MNRVVGSLLVLGAVAAAPGLERSAGAHDVFFSYYAPGPVYASPVVYSSPVVVSPVVYAAPVYAAPVYVTPAYYHPVYVTPVYSAPVYVAGPRHYSLRYRSGPLRTRVVERWW